MHGTFWEHTEALRTAVIRSLCSVGIGIVLAFFFHQEVIQFLLIPLKKSGVDVEIALFTPLEGISSSFMVSFWAGMLVSTPFWISHIIRFIIPALHSGEIRLLLPFLVISLVFLILGFLCAFFFSIPLSNYYLYSFNETLGKNIWSLTEYLSYTIIFLLAHGVAFEMCAILLFLVHFGLISVDAMIAKRRHVIVGAFILGALLTPPDVLSQVILSAILLTMYEAAIFYGKLRQKNVLARI